MFKYVDAQDEKGGPLGGTKGASQAKELLGIKEPGCPVVELETAGRFAVWCAAPLADGVRYPALHGVPKSDGDKAKFSWVK